MEDTAKVIGAKIGREKLKKQTQTRVCVYTPGGRIQGMRVDNSRHWKVYKYRRCH